MREKEKVLLVGIGELGGIVLEYIVRIPGICDIVTADWNEEWGFHKTNSAILGASYMGLYPKIQFTQIDLLDIERTAEQLRAINPTIIYNGTTLQSWWVVNELPAEVRARLYLDMCGLGAWSAMHLALMAKLMSAIRMADIEPYVVNAAFPDMTNASLARVGLAPTVGIGNMDLIVPYIRKAAAERLHVPIRSVGVEMIAHHYHGYHWCRDGEGYDAPHHLRVYVDREDVTDKLGDMRQFISELPQRAMRPAGRHGQFVVAASSLKNIMAILDNTDELTHSPGPQGLEGGYPIRLSRRGAEVVVPRDMSLEQARDLMLEAQKWDGIEEIRDNGDVVLTEFAYSNFKDLLGVDCKVVTIKDSYEQARELRAKFDAFARQHGVEVPH